PGSLASQTANSIVRGFNPPTTCLVIRKSAMAASSEAQNLWGSTGETPKRKPGERPGSTVSAEIPVSSDFPTIGEKPGNSRNWTFLEWHSRGRGFDSPWLHQPPPSLPFTSLRQPSKKSLI